MISVGVGSNDPPVSLKPDFSEGNMPMRSLWTITATALLASLCLITTPAAPRAQELNAHEFTTPLDIRMGERLFQQQCGRCHGIDAGGGELGPDLTSGYRTVSTDAGLFDIIRNGLPNSQMIGISRASTDQSVWMVVSYLNSLNETPDVNLPGNATNGEQLFAGKGNCSSCHMVNGQGGRRGQDLSRVGETIFTRRCPAAASTHGLEFQDVTQ